MNDPYISALAALAGSGIGALASIVTTWLAQRHQDRSQRLAQIRVLLRRLFYVVDVALHGFLASYFDSSEATPKAMNF